MAANEFVHVDPGSVLTQNEYNASPGSAGGHTLGANQAVGDLIYASSAGATGIIRRLAIGTTNQTLVVSGGIPAWSSTITATTIDATTDFTVGSTVITDDVITFTPTTSDTVTMTAAANGAFSLVTVDDGGAAANIQITADGTVDIDSAGVLTLDSGAAINIEPASGSAILLDGTISIDAGVVTGATSITSTAFVGNLTGNVTGTASTATVATTVTITDNESTNEDNAIIFTAGGDVDGGNIGLESDGTLTYNPSTGKITATGFIGTLTGDVTGNVSGTAATVTTAAQSNITSLGTLTALTVSGLITANGGITFDDDDDITFTGASGTNDIVLVDGLADALSITDGSADILTVSTAGGTNTVAITGDLTVSGTLTADTATVASTVTITDNENTNESNAVIFTSGGDLDGGNIALESDGDLHYNPSSGLLTATSFAGALTGNVTGNVSGTAATVTGATQSAITAVGTLGSIDIDGGAIDGVTLGTNAAVTQAVIDNININGTTIGHTSDTDLLTLTSANLAVAGDIEVSGSVEVATIDYTDGDLAMTIADGGGVTFAQDATLTSHKYLNLPENSSIKFTDQIGVDNSIDNDDGQGIIFTFRAGATVTPFSPVYIDGNNEVQECNANAIATMPCIGVTMNTSDVSADADIEVMMLGLIRHDSFSDFGAAGAPVYASGTAGALTTTAPSGTDDVVQVVGHSIAEDLIFVQPCLTTIEHA